MTYKNIWVNNFNPPVSPNVSSETADLSEPSGLGFKGAFQSEFRHVFLNDTAFTQFIPELSQALPGVHAINKEDFSRAQQNVSEETSRIRGFKEMTGAFTGGLTAGMLNPETTALFATGLAAAGAVIPGAGLLSAALRVGVAAGGTNLTQRLLQREAAKKADCHWWRLHRM